jgi:hypothetical protein
LQLHLAGSQEPYDGQKRLYVLDESSLASTKQMNEFLHRLKENDEKINDSGNLQVRLDSGRAVAFNIKENPHLDYRYAVTSHSSRGQTANRVLVHVDTEQGGEKLVYRRLAYAAVSRALRCTYINDKV